MTTRSSRARRTGFSFQPLDRMALGLMALLSVLITVLLLMGSTTAPRVREFTWQDAQISSADRAFLLNFTRPMDRDSVEQGLTIEPPLPGKFSWAGRRMAYTLDEPTPYGTEFTLTLEGARDRFSDSGDGQVMPTFEAKFRARDRAFVYLGVDGENAGRLMLNNLTQKDTQVLTPPDLVVMDYTPYPEGDRILFSASDRAELNQGTLNQKLYTVTTGIHIDTLPQTPFGQAQDSRSNRSRDAQPPGIISLVLDSDDYQNLKFDLSADGRFFVVQRVNRSNPGDYGLWLVPEGEAAQPLDTEPGGDFLIAPDSSTLAMAQGQGMAILPLGASAEPLDFLPKFGMVMSFSPDGAAAAMVRFNENPDNPTRSLFLVTNQGTEQQLLETNGSFLSAQFDQLRSLLYVLITQRIEAEEYIEEPYLVVVNLTNNEAKTLLKLPIQRDIQMHLSPDGLGLLFDQVVTDESANPADEAVLRGSDGRAIASSQLWVQPILKDVDGSPSAIEPQPLPIAGIRPRWLP